MTPYPAPPPQNMPALVARIQRDFANMTPQFQIGARYLIDCPADIPVASMRRIAEQAGVQPATLVRLAQSLGYQGWDDLKRIYVQALRSEPKRYAVQARKLVRDANPTALGQAVAVQADNIQALGQANAGRMAAATRMLSAAPHVHIAGFRASYAPAFTFQYLYRLFRPSVSLLRSDAGTLEMELRAINRRDATVIISFAPYSHESMQVADAARKAGSKVLAICDSVVAPIALQADCVLVFSTNTPSFFPSSTPALALVEILIAQLLAQAGPKAVEGLKRAEEQLHATGAYLNAR
ncbi:MurR/RpiR family transcriptional regulator [Allopusillimonas ginsengisoli]|uniref:MurR/RpiR family transcriptional regulator n=1 Tax=Allopusillimonas ginsengisoli TaxID=453575 RepID=UPI0010229FA9|nr:MurR/RpiR family transcriptional regulator [Allopusillimonas ginsengisoli]TEA77840.1 MurR/RpiR family transcriptional regulator [Allopusillimonas ginsengisoli]